MRSASETAFNDVSAVLWRERDLLDGLAYELEVQRLVLLAGDERWLARACREIETTLGLLRSAELVRAVRVDILASELGLQPSPTLRMLVAAVGQPWCTIFGCHRRAFVQLTRDVGRLAESNRERLSAARSTGDRRPAGVGGRPRPSSGAPGAPVEAPVHLDVEQ